MKRAATGSSLVNAHCNRCLGETKHKVIATETKVWPDAEDANDNSIWGKEVHELLRCQGCDSITLRHCEWSSEDTDDRGQPIRHINYFPPAVSRQKPKWLTEFLLNLPIGKSGMRWLVDEIYAALHSDLNRLAAMGIRTLVDMVMTERIGDVGTFSAKLNKLQNEGYISRVQRELLERTIDAGNAAAHRGYKPDKVDLESILGIVENLIETIYVHTNQAKAFSKKIPKRKI